MQKLQASSTTSASESNKMMSSKMSKNETGDDQVYN